MKFALLFVLWFLMLCLCWPVALAALILFPFVWALALPFRLAILAVEGILALLRAVVLLPARLLNALAN